MAIVPPEPPVEVHKIEIYLKSGHTIKVTCESWKFDYSNYTGEYTGYEFKGLIDPRRIGIVPNQIVGFSVKR